MPVVSGQAKAIACLYGGQGTINVPSCSPAAKFKPARSRIDLEKIVRIKF